MTALLQRRVTPCRDVIDILDEQVREHMHRNMTVRQLLLVCEFNEPGDTRLRA